MHLLGRHIVLWGAAAVLGLLAPAGAADINWNAADGKWTEEAKWSGGKLPSAADLAIIDSGGKVTLDEDVTVGAVRVNNGELIVADGNLLIEGASGTSGLMIAQSSGTSGVLTQTGGEISFGSTGNRQLNIGRRGSGTYYLKSGTLDLTNATEIAIARDTDGTGRLIQTGGLVYSTGNATIIMYAASGTGAGSIWEVSGGEISLQADFTNNINSIQLQAGATFKVIGSAAKIAISRFRNDSNDAIFEFVLDNSAGHISTITSKSTDFRMRGHLRASLAGGVLLTGQDSFDLVSAGQVTEGYASMPTAGTSLWDTAIKESKKVAITLAADARKGELDLAGGSASLALQEPAIYGFVDLANVDLGQSLLVSLDVAGGELTKLQDKLTQAGISWAAGKDGYDVQLLLNPAVSGGSHFAWDLSELGSVDDRMTVERLAITAVPEPMSMGLAVVAAGMVSLGRRRIV